MGDTSAKQKINTYFLDLGEHLGTYNKWCNRVKNVNCVGNLELLSSDNKIAIMGGRKLSNYGERVVERIINEICVSGKLTIISGDLQGVERRTCEIVRSKKFGMVLVTAKKIDKALDEYGWVIDGGGLIVSIAGKVLPRFEQVDTHKLMAALAKRVLFFEVGAASGSFKTALKYFEKNLDVMIVPYPIENLYGDGGNKLLASGVGRLVCGVEDVMLRVLDTYIDIENDIKVIVGYLKNDTLYKAILEGSETVESMIGVTGLPMDEIFVRLQKLLSEKVVVERNSRYFVA